MCKHQTERLPASQNRAQRLAESQLEKLRLVEGKSVAQDHSQGGREPGLQASLAADPCPWRLCALAVLCSSPAFVVLLCTRGASVNGKLVGWRWQEVGCVYTHEDAGVILTVCVHFASQFTGPHPFVLFQLQQTSR